MGFRDRFKSKSQHQEKQKSGSTFSIETGGHKIAITRDIHYVPRNDSADTRPPLPPRPRTTISTVPQLPPRTISQESAPAVLQHQHDPASVQRNRGLLSILVGMVSRQKDKTSGTKKSSDGIWTVACVMGFSLFMLVLCYTALPLSTALAVGGVAYAVTAIALHYMKSQDRRHEVTITAQKEVMIAMVEKGHGQSYAAAMTSGFLETSGSRNRLLEYD